MNTGIGKAIIAVAIANFSWLADGLLGLLFSTLIAVMIAAIPSQIAINEENMVAMMAKPPRLAEVFAKEEAFDF